MTASSSHPAIDLAKRAAKLLHTHDLGEVELQHGDLRVRVAARSAALPPQEPTAPVALAAQRTESTAANPSAPTEPAAPTSNANIVRAPMVGTAYLAPEPGAQPFIQQGDHVSKGQTLLIIEAMKTMNHILAPRDGTISQILVIDQQPVEYDAPLVQFE